MSLLNVDPGEINDSIEPLRYVADVGDAVESVAGLPFPGNTQLEQPPTQKFATKPNEAVPVFERGASHFASMVVGLSTTPFQLVGRRKGRRSITLWCPSSYTPPGGSSSTPTGFQFAEDRGKLDSGVGTQLNAGDSVTLTSEAPVWVAPFYGTSGGTVFYVEEFDQQSEATR